MSEVKSEIENFEWRTGRACVFKIFFHLVFVTKYRRDVFNNLMLDDLQNIFKETCQQMGGELLEFGGESDHVHLIVSATAKTSISSLVGKLKGKSSYVLRKKYWEELRKKLWGTHLWSPSYCVVTCGGAPLEIIKEYVKNQKQPPTQKAIEQSERVIKRFGSLTHS